MTAGVDIHFAKGSYTRVYSGGADPQHIEADIFKIIFPLVSIATEQATEQAIEHYLAPEKMVSLLTFCHTVKTVKEIMEF